MAKQDGDEVDRKLLGRLIRSYREDSTHGGGKLSPEALLHLMSVHDGVKNDKKREYRHDLSLVRCEEGKGSVSSEFLEDFCTALEIAAPERDSMLRLANIPADGEKARISVNPLDTVLKGSVGKLAPPGGYASIGGFSLAALGLEGTQSLLLYASGLLALVTGLGIWRWRKLGWSDEVVDDLFFVSLFIVLNTPHLQGTVTRTDPYGFYAIPAVGVGVFPFMLAMMMHLALSLAAWAVFIFMRKWMYERNRTRTSPYQRAIATTLPPTLLVYVILMLLTNPGGWIYFLVVLGILFGTFFAIMALKDADVQLSDEQAKWSFIIAIELIIILSSFGIAGMLASYVNPNLVISGETQNLFWSWEMDFEALGYPEDQFLPRFQVGMVWTSLATIAYLSLVVGGYLVRTIQGARREQATDDSARPEPG